MGPKNSRRSLKSAGERSFQFATELRTQHSTQFEEALHRIVQIARDTSYYPMLVTPYLREAQLEELRQQQVSGIDLSGNGVITIPGKLFVYRTGKPNKFPDSARPNTPIVEPHR